MTKKTTYSTVFIKGIPLPSTNIVTKETKEYYISYDNYSIKDYGSDTTALYIKDTSQFLILNGDHTEAYEKCASLKECVAYFYENIEQANKLSDHGTVFKFNDGKAKYVKGGY